MIYSRDLWLSSYDSGVPADITLEHDSLPHCFEAIRSRFPHKPAVHCLGLTLTFDQLLTYSDQFAAGLAEHGIGKGDVLAISLPNSPQYLIGLIGGLKAGCAVSGLSPLFSKDEVLYQLSDSRAKAFLVLDVIFEHRFLPVCDQAIDLQLVIPTGLLDFLPAYKRLVGKWLKKFPTGCPCPISGKRVCQFRNFVSAHRPVPLDVKISQEDPCYIQYTGGTTGTPKGAVCVHRNMLSNVTQWDAWLQVDKGRDVLLSAYPIFHIAGLFTATVGLAFGLAQILIPNPRDTRHICRKINRYQPTFLANVPSLYLMLAQEPAFARCNLSRLRYCISGAAPFPAESIRQFESIVGEGKVIEVYGMTETCVIVTATPRSGKKKIGSVGLPVPSTYIRIVDLLSGKEDVPLGEEGEIIASGPQVMKAYHDKPHETDQALRQHDGRIWMHTGDIGRMDEEGYLTIVDRAKDMASVGGFKVFPREIEEKLYALPFIEVCAALGISNPERPETEVVKLIVQPKEAYSQTPEHELRNEIISFAKEHFAPFKVPKLIEFGEIPLTPAGKVDKKELRSR